MPESQFATILNRKQDSSQPVMLSRKASRNWQELYSDVVRVASCLINDPARECAIYTHSAYWCAVAALAGLTASKQLLLMPNVQSDTLQQLGRETVLLLDDVGLVGAVPVASLDVVGARSMAADVPARVSFSTSQRVDLFTSGSTGTPARINKTLGNFEAEVICLESLWGAQIVNARVLATVSHQHIYGFLFRVLWPLIAERPFQDGLIEYPEQLQAQDSAASVLISSPAFLKRVTAEASLNLPGWVFSSGGPLAPEVNRTLCIRTGCTLIEVFGSTETGGVATRNLALDQAWQLMPPVMADRHNHQQLDIDSPHCVDGRYTMSDRCQWLDERRFNLLGRTDRIVKLEEKRISLPEVETKVKALDWVSECHALVLPGPRDFLGLVAVLTNSGSERLAEAGTRRLKDEIRSQLEGILEPVVQPRKIRFAEQMPQTSQGKIDRIAVEELFRARSV